MWSETFLRLSVASGISPGVLLVVWFSLVPASRYVTVRLAPGAGVAPEVVVDGLRDPSGLALDRLQRLYVVEVARRRVVRYDPVWV